MPSVLGFEPPGTEGHEDDTAGIARMCALTVHDSARFRSVEKALDRHSDATVACTGARVMTACMVRLYFGWEGRNLPENRALVADFEKYSLRLNEATERACRGIDFKHPDIVALFNTVRIAWQNTMQTWFDRH